MRWAEVYAYITSVAPDLAADMVGVPEEHIVACETNWRMVFPSAYREFLLTLGVEAGRFRPLGGYAVWDFYEVLRDPPEEYEPRELLRISTETDDSLVTHNDYYLDMRTQTPDGDCELLMIEWAMPPRRADAIVEHRTFLERVVKVAWIQLDAKRFRFSDVLIGVTEEGDEQPLYTGIIELLRVQGFVPSSPTSPRVTCWVRDASQPVSAAVSSGGGAVELNLASDSKQTIGQLVHVASDKFPVLRLDRRRSR
jgi:hypothetical protein